eukprot:TRINITY_DN1213_c0_g2_i1.p1 TRINITY_DN1213_c0_g2~~TRINITY_DN1213_c0_g2_i1.p1  ORF type:complete len:656 (+),score=79.85 TRINITY_DN1213_c0_g2_i1:41-1969(+)
MVVRSVAALLSLAGVSNGFYIPGAIQLPYTEGMIVDSGPFVNTLTSTDGIIPYEYYSLKYCKPVALQPAMKQNVGMMLSGTKIQSSLYEFTMMKNETCKRIECSGKDAELDKKDLDMFDELIGKGYRANMVLDNLPLLTTRPNTSATCRRFRNENRIMTDIRGVAVGSCSDDSNLKTHSFIFNHIDFEVRYNQKQSTVLDDDGERVKVPKYFIVAFKGTPSSRNSEDCDPSAPEIETVLPAGKKTLQVPWTYSVTWILDRDTHWTTRWDNYLNSSEAGINSVGHWFKLAQALVIVMSLASIVGFILIRALRIDLRRYNEEFNNKEDLLDEWGWKLIEGDVFRPPAHPQIFAAVIGTGTQLIGMSCAVLTFALLGFLSPSNRGGFITSTLFIFVLMSFFNGFVTAKIQRMFNARQWKTVIVNYLVYPGVLYATWLITGLFISIRSSMKASLLLLGLWLFVSLPLLVSGAAFGFRQAPIENPRSVNQLCRLIPAQHWYFSTPVIMILPGLVPYAAAHFEINLILQAIWQGQVYYVFGFLSLVFLVVSITIALTSITLVYYQLVAEDYRWWWTSVFSMFAVGLYYFSTSCVYYHSILNVTSPLATFVFFAFTAHISIMIFLIAGTISFYSSFIFVRVIYASLKVD